MQSHRSPDFELSAAVDPLPDRLAEARDLGGCRTYRRYADMWKHENPDVVAIASPTRLHERAARRALREGAHVILEKPMTTNLASADRIIEEATKQDRKVFVYQPHRLTPETQTAREIIQSGVLGPVYLIRRSTGRYVRRSDWQSLRKHGGGMLNNYGAHYIDQLLHLSDGSPIEDVRCNLWAVATVGDADDVVKVWLQTRTGQLLDLEINQASAWPHAPWHICGRYGTAVLEDKAFRVRYYDPKEAPPLEVVDGAAPGRSYDLGDRLPWVEEEVPVDPAKQRQFYPNVYDAIVNNAEPHVRVEESRELIRIMEWCRRRAKF